MAWSIYRRVRRNIGRQKLKPARIALSLTIFTIASFFIITAAASHLNLLLSFGGGLAVGGGLGFLGLRLTRFETTEEGHFYTPDMRLGIGISLLLAARLLYRFWVLRNGVDTGYHPPAMQSPLTFFIIGLTFGYYVVYYIGLFVHTRDRK